MKGSGHSNPERTVIISIEESKSRLQLHDFMNLTTRM